MNDARQFSFRQIMRKNPLVEFTVSNIVSLNLIGGLAIWRIRNERPLGIVILTSFTPLLIASVVLLLTGSSQTGPSWRMIAVWSILLVPFTARLLSGSFGKPLTMLILGAFLFDTARIQRNSAWAFPESDRQAGIYLNSLVAAHPDTKILIESSQYFYLNIQVASQHPKSFVKNPAPMLAPGIGYLVFQTAEYKNSLNTNPGLRKLEDFGPWSIYSVLHSRL